MFSYYFILVELFLKDYLAYVDIQRHIAKKTLDNYNYAAKLPDLCTQPICSSKGRISSFRIGPKGCVLNSESIHPLY